MKNLKLLFALLVLSVNSISTTAQVTKQIHGRIELTQSGNDARITGIDSVGLPNDAVNVLAVQQGRLIFAADTGTTGNYFVNLNPAVSSLQPGTIINFKANSSNTTATNLTVNGLGPYPIKKYVDMDLQTDDIRAGQMVSVIFDGVNFQMISPLGNAPPTAGGDEWLIYTANGF